MSARRQETSEFGNKEQRQECQKKTRQIGVWGQLATVTGQRTEARMPEKTRPPISSVDF